MPNQPKDPKPTPGPWIKKFYKDGETWGVRQSPEAPSVSLEGENISCGFSICNMVDNGDATEANADLIVTARDTATERDRLKEINAEFVEAIKELYANIEAVDSDECYALNIEIHNKRTQAVKQRLDVLLAKTQEVQDVKN